MKIERYSGFNISGLARVKFALVSRVKKISPPDQDHLVSFRLKPGFDLDEILFTRQAEDVSIEEITDDSGTWYRVKVKLINPRLGSGKAATFRMLEQRDLVFVLEDNNGNEMLIGSTAMPARLSYKMSIPGSSRNQRMVTIDAKHDVEPYYIREYIIQPGGAFSNGFSQGFNI